MIYCGIDWAERTHDVALVDDSGQLMAKRHITDDAAGYKILLEMLAEYGDTEEHPIPVAIETSRGLLVAVLRQGKRKVFAMNRVVTRSHDLLDDRGPGSLGFYTSGQLFLGEYYTLAVLVRAGVGTNHLDGNTRLCTSTAAKALKESFGCDGQPGSYDDIDHADVIALFGHNIAETQPVQWMRILDRLAGTEPPRLRCVDPRPTQVARRAAAYLAPRIGTNLALLNALLHEIIRADRADHAYVEAHTVGYEELAARVKDCTPRWAGGSCDIPARQISEAAELLGTAGRLRVTRIRPGLLFVPFHYGYWDTPDGAGPDDATPGRAANETTITDWDPASEQPLFKTAARALTLVERGNGATGQRGNGATGNRHPPPPPPRPRRWTTRASGPPPEGSACARRRSGTPHGTGREPPGERHPTRLAHTAPG